MRRLHVLYVHHAEDEEIRNRVNESRTTKDSVSSERAESSAGCSSKVDFYGPPVIQRHSMKIIVLKPSVQRYIMYSYIMCFKGPNEFRIAI